MAALKHSIYIIIAQFSLLVSGAIINLGLGRFLGPSLYGQFGIVFAVATIINLLFTPGIVQAVSKFSAAKKLQASSLAGGMLKNQLVFSLIIAFLYYFAAAPIALVLRDSSLTSLLQLLTPLIVIYAVTAVYSGYVTGIGRFGLQATQLITYSVTRLLATFVLAYFFSLTGAVISLPIAAFIALAYFIFTSKLKPAKSKSSSIYKFALPITTFMALITFFVSIDLFLVKALLQDNILAGYYTAASVIARIPYFVLTALGMVMLPSISSKLSSGKPVKSYIQENFRYILVILLPTTALIAATSKPLVMLLYRSEYAAASIPLSILTLGMAALTLTYLFAVVVNAAGYPAITAATAFGMLALSVAFNYTLIPIYQLAGAAISTTLASVLSMCILFAIVYNKVGFPLNFASFVKTALVSLLLFIAASKIDLENKFLLPGLYIILGLVYLAIMILIKEIRKDDFKKLLELLPGRFSGIFS